MGISCLFGHKWNGCMCVRCKTNRNLLHDYQAIDGKCVEKCTICGKTHDVAHKWIGCKCITCGKVRRHSIRNDECVYCKIKAYKCNECDGSGIISYQVEYASYLSGHQLGSDIWEYETCSTCKGDGYIYDESN